MPLPLPLLPLPPRSRTLWLARHDARARARVAICARILRDEDRVTRREPPASRQPLRLRHFVLERWPLVLVVVLAARDDAVAVRRAARDETHARRTPLFAAAARPWQPSTFCSTLLSLSPWLDAQRSSQLREEQPHAAARVAVARVGVELAQRRTPAKDSYLDSYLCYLDSYLDKTGYLEAIWGLDSSRG